MFQYTCIICNDQIGVLGIVIFHIQYFSTLRTFKNSFYKLVWKVQWIVVGQSFPTAQGNIGNHSSWDWCCGTHTYSRKSCHLRPQPAIWILVCTPAAPLWSSSLLMVCEKQQEMDQVFGTQSLSGISEWSCWPPGPALPVAANCGDSQWI